jgi:hypothetical protein
MKRIAEIQREYAENDWMPTDKQTCSPSGSRPAALFRARRLLTLAHIVLREAGLTFDLESVDLKAKKLKNGADY